jgi:type III restriction enzyme
MWLQTRRGKFYPDFVAELLDGRLLMVEYKGAHLATGEDTKHKAEIGDIWERNSNGEALFLMAVKKDANGLNVHEQIRAKIEGWQRR